MAQPRVWLDTVPMGSYCGVLSALPLFFFEPRIPHIQTHTKRLLRGKKCGVVTRLKRISYHRFFAALLSSCRKVLETNTAPCVPTTMCHHVLVGTTHP